MRAIIFLLLAIAFLACTFYGLYVLLEVGLFRYSKLVGWVPNNAVFFTVGAGIGVWWFFKRYRIEAEG